jgi:hypothetical protein
MNVSSVKYDKRRIVAQSGTLLYRRLAIGGLGKPLSQSFRASADCQSATQPINNLRYRIFQYML